MQHRAADVENKRKSRADKERRRQHQAADREYKKKSRAEEGRRMQHRAAVRACQAQRQKSKCYRKKCSKSASISQKYRLQHEAAYQKYHEIVCYKNQTKRLQCDAIFKKIGKRQEHVQQG